jgi:hypothetical protein
LGPEVFEYLWEKDHLDRHFIHYASLIDQIPIDKNLKADASEQVKQAMVFLQKNIENKNHTNKLIDKYYWTYKYCTTHSSNMNEIKNVILIPANP